MKQKTMVRIALQRLQTWTAGYVISTGHVNIRFKYVTSMTARPVAQAGFSW
jgi:hypothetical protein